MNSEWDLVFVGIAALVAGAVNAIAGGGTLITFPILSALGVPLVAASVTNIVALCPGYLGGALAQRNELRGQTRLLWLVLPVAVVADSAVARSCSIPRKSRSGRWCPFSSSGPRC